MVPELGIEPRCPCERGILSPLRLPVSPLRHGQRLYRRSAKSQAKNCWQSINAHVKGAAQFRKSYWGCSSAGRALEWHSRGQRFDPAHLHQLFKGWVSPTHPFAYYRSSTCFLILILFSLIMAALLPSSHVFMASSLLMEINIFLYMAFFASKSFSSSLLTSLSFNIT